MSYKDFILYFKREWLFLFIFVLLISFSQAIILKPHLEFGFSPDDVWFFSDFSALGSPFSKFNQVWQSAGPYHAPHIYYNGILFTLFSFHYLSYQIASLIFKILSIISLYILIQVVFNNRLLAFASGIIFAIHYGSVGSMEMVARTQDYLLIPAMNIFFILFYLNYLKKPKNISWIILTSAIFFFSFFINPIRAYPYIPFILLLGAIIYSRDRSVSNLRWITKSLIVIFLPLILFFSLMGNQYTPGNFLTIIQKASVGNLQVFLTPFTTVGGLFLVGDSLKFFSSPTWALSDFLGYFLGGPLIFFGVTTIILSKILSKNPIRFFSFVFITNFIFELILFLMLNKALNLPPELKMDYNVFFYAPAAVLGIYIITLMIFIFKEWLGDQKNNFLSLYLIGMLFATTFICFTWFFQDFVYIPMGINGYSTLPTMGISASIASILVLAYTKLKNAKYHSNYYGNLAPTIFLIPILYFFFSNNQIQIYLKRYLYYGMAATDQMNIRNKFWQSVKNPEACDKFFFLDDREEPNKYFYETIMIDRFDRWYSLYSPHHSKKLCPVALLVNDEEKLFSSYNTLEGREGFLYKYFNGGDNFFSLEDFYAFKLQNRDIIDIKPEILKEIRLSQ